MIKTKLRNLVTEYSLRNRNGSCTDVYSVTNSQGFIPSTDYFSKEVFSKDLTTYKIVKKGMIAYNPSRINVGSVAVQRVAEEVIVSPLYVVFSVNEDELIPEYLTYFLHSDKGLHQISSNTSGSVRDSLKFTALQNIEINTYSLEEQKEIIVKFQKFERLIEKQKALLKKLDDLVKSQFIEMFGDPIRNTQKRVTTEFINVVKMQRGFDLPVQERVQSGNVLVFGSNGALDRHNVAKVLGGGVITGRSGTIGKVFYTEEDYWPLNTSLFSVDTHGNNIIFLAYLLQLYDLTRFTEGTGVPTLNRNKFHNQQIIDVPLDEQNAFARFVKQTDKSKLHSHLEVAA